ncbi:MAG: hypothetical protein M3081_06740 [Gemmatimonadota bacterium]|nr:hypothetical protein [Gemmatimonadota bacterium]
MSTDWDKEMAKIDKQLESITDDQLLPAPKNAPPAVQSKVAVERAETSTLGVFLRLLLAVALGVGIVFWPYSARCGLGLAAYLGAVGALLVAGGWTSWWSWKHRSARAHVLSLLLILWALVLGTSEVLPRIGYAKASAAWVCK